MVPEDEESHTNMITFFNQNNSRPNTSQPIQLAPELFKSIDHCITTIQYQINSFNWSNTGHQTK